MYVTFCSLATPTIRGLKYSGFSGLLWIIITNSIGISMDNSILRLFPTIRGLRGPGKESVGGIPGTACIYVLMYICIDRTIYR